jgi:hypothetical protein
MSAAAENRPGTLLHFEPVALSERRMQKHHELVITPELKFESRSSDYEFGMCFTKKLYSPFGDVLAGCMSAQMQQRRWPNLNFEI